MTKNEYNLRHISCNMNDFRNDQHRFRFYYEGEEYIAVCCAAVGVEYYDSKMKHTVSLPKDVEVDVQKLIYSKIDKEEKNWRYPEEAYKIADEYVEEEFEQ